MHDVDLYRLVSAPRPPRPEEAEDPAPAQMLAALTATHAALGADGDPLVVAGRIRAPGDPDVRVVVGGRPWFPPAATDETPAPGGDVPVLCPPGARGVPLGRAALGGLTGALPCWVACTGQDDALWLPEDPARPGPARSSFDDFVAHLHGGFGWVLLAEPLPGAEIEVELARLTTRIPQLRTKESSEQARVDLARAETRYRELARARVTGMWRVRVLVGGETPSAARTAAALLCGAGELESLPYVLVPGTEVLEFADAAGKPVDAGATRSPFVASSELVAALARPPAGELPGIRLADRPTFDVTPEIPGSGVPLGRVLDGAGRPAGAFAVPTDTLNRHAFVCGSTGSGKSQTMRTLLEGLTRHAPRVPWLVIEPAKAEYARMAGRIAGVDTVTVIRPGAPDVPPASLNPLEPEPGFGLQSHADLVRALFLAAFDANEPFPQVLSRALTEVYTDAGFNLVTGDPRPQWRPRLRLSEERVRSAPRYPTLGMLQETASRVVSRIGYGKEITADVRGFVDVRMGSLREGTPGRFFEGGHPLDIGKLLSGNVVLELEDITNDQDKAFLIGAVLIRVVEHLRMAGPQPGLQHVTVVEEAHRLLRNVTEGPAAAAVELFASLLAEIRAYGEGVVVVEQIPSKIVPDVVKNSALKVLHRLPSADDRDVVGSTMNLQPDQSEQVVAFPPGVAAVTVDGMDRPVMLRVPPGEADESADGAVPLTGFGGTRSPLCGDACRVAPCTLAAIDDDADRAGAAAPAMWTELVTLSVLTGEPPPRPAPSVRTALVDDGEHRRRCRLVAAVERSVSARGPELRDWVDPGDLAAHVLSTVDALLDGADPPGDRDWLRYTAGYFRWQVVRAALRGAGTEPVHPHTEDWADLGLPLPGPTRADQLAQLQAHPSYRDGAELVVLGDPARSGLSAALRELSGAEDTNAVRRAVWLSCGSAVSAGFPTLVADLLDEHRRGV